MRVLQVISGIEPENGGPTAALSGLSRALRKAGADISIVATWKSRSAFATAEALRADGIEVTLIGPTRRPFRRHRLIGPTLRTEIARADVVHIHALWEAVQHRAAVISRQLGKPYVWTPHGMLDRFNMQKRSALKSMCLRLYLRKDLSAASLLHFASEFEREQVARHNFTPPTAVIGLGVDEAVLNEATEADAKWGTQFGLDGTSPMVLFLGRLQRGKGLEFLIPAIASVRQSVLLVVAGPDEGHRLQFETLARRCGIADRVRFIGMLGLQDKIAAMRSARILAAPSLHENFGISVAEAISLGTTVVISDQVGLASVVRGNDLGQVTPLDPAKIASSIETMLDRNAARSERGRTVGKTIFDWSNIAAAWIGEYERAGGLERTR